MNTHEHLSIEVLADYAEGLLGDADATSVAEQLASCADCQAEANLLVSVTSILAADDPGPMPAHYAARIDAALADLAAAEPVTPKRRETTTVGAGATVIDLASRRRFTPAARVTSVAASLVLLIGGVALGMQALDTSGSGNPGDDQSAIGTATTPPSDSARYLAYALSAQERPQGNDAKKGKNGSVIDKRTGTVFLKSGKVVFPDGVIVVPKKGGNTEVRTYDVKTGKAKPMYTFRPEETQPRSTPSVQSTPVVTPDVTPKPTPKATPSPEPTVAPPTSDPYVTNSGDAYSQENFAAKVQDLLRKSGDVQPVFRESSESSESTTPSPTDQNRVSAGALRSDDAALPARGPAPADVETKVKRCANQLELTGLLAGDAGTWKDQPATILVTRYAENPKQAVGYVVLGDCTREDPATKASVPWEQRVALPEAEEAPNPAPTSTPAPSDTVPGAVSNRPSNSTEQ